MISLECIEKKQNIKFPEAYVELCQSNFYGISKMNIQVDEDSININKFLDANEINDVLDEFYDYFGYDIVPIAEVEYEDFICLDFRVNKQNPEIVYWNYELALENPIEGTTLLYSSMNELIFELKKDESLF